MLRTLPDIELLRRLRAIRFSPKAERNARRAVSMHGLAQATGISRMHLYRVARGEPLTPRVRRLLTEVLTCNEIDRERSGPRPAQEGSRGRG